MERFVLHNRDPRFLERVMNGLTDMIRVVNRQREVVWMNERVRRIMDDPPGGVCPGDCDGGCDECVCIKAMELARPVSATRRYRGRVYRVTASPVPEETGEIGFAIEVWRDMTGEMRMRERIMNQNDKLVQDLNFARRLQQALLPDRMPSPGRYFYDALYRPCEMVGGDFYDVFSLDGGAMVFYVADVAGHGVTAAMLTVFFSQTVRSVLQTRHSAQPDAVLREISGRFAQMGLEEHLYITAWLACLDPETGRLAYSNAGHIAAPLLWDGREVRSLEMAGMPICRWMEDVTYRVEYAQLPPGGRLLIHTDGLSDAWRNSGSAQELTGYDSARELARYCLTTQPAEIVLPAIWDQVSRGMDEKAMNDDIAMLLVAREPLG